MSEEKAKILIVDDESFNIHTLNALLKNEYKVMVASSGEQALKGAANSKPDLILLDIMMPQMDGYEVLNRLKSDQATENIPVIFITAIDNSEDETKGFELGVVDYITKPFNKSVVIARVRTHIRLKQKNDQLEKLVYESEQQKKQIEVQKNMLSSTTEAVQEAIFLIDDKSLTIYTNTAASKMFGYSKEELVGENLHDLIVPKKYYSDYKVAFQKFVKTGKGALIGNVIEVTAMKKNGTQFPVSISITSLKIDNKWHAAGVVSDITERKKAEADIQDKNEMMIVQSKRASMGEMISMIAHQWRQPLGVLALQVQDIPLECEYGGMDKEYLDKQTKEIMDTINYMSNTIDDFRNFFKPTNSIEKIHTSQIIKTTNELVRALLKHHDIELVIEDNFNDYIYVLLGEFIQVLLNLIKNAKDIIIESDICNGKILIKTEKNDAMFCLYVCDNGGGIPEEIKDKIFESYFTTKNDSGTGIGLHMSKIIIEDHFGGTLDVKNSDKGACFIITIPIKGIISDET